MKIVVIGGSGLIGTKLVHKLRQLGHEVVAASPASGVNTITGEGLAEALAGAQVVVDVANSPSFEDKAVLAFFETSGRNLLAAEAAAGVGHHVALSVVGADRLPDSDSVRQGALYHRSCHAVLRVSGRHCRIEPRRRHGPPAARPDAAHRRRRCGRRPGRRGCRDAGERHCRVGRPRTATHGCTRPTILERTAGHTSGGRRRPRTLLRRRTERSLPHPGRQPAYRPDAFRGLAQPLHTTKVG